MNQDRNEVSIIETLDRVEATDKVEVGKWYLINQDKKEFYATNENSQSDREVVDSNGNILVCVENFESNLVVMKSNMREFRILNKNLGHVLLDIDQHKALPLVQEKGLSQQTLIVKAQEEIREIIKRINHSGSKASDSTEVAVATKNTLVEQTRVLKEVHSTKLEALNDEIRGYVSNIHDITKYYSLPSTAGMIDHQKTKSIVDEKLHELNLYGGLNESEEIVSVGGVTSESRPIYIFQNLKYMDVECLIGYESGGISIDSIDSFNKWLAEPINRDRIMPKDRSIVAIKVRKYPDRRMLGWFAEKNPTYLYLRNGENIKCIKTGVSISETLLATENNLGGRFYVKKIHSYSDKSKNFEFLSKHEYDHLLESSEKLKAFYLDTLLDSYKALRRFLVGMGGYAEHKHSILNINKEKDCKNLFEIRNGSMFGYKPSSQSLYDKQRVLYQEAVDDTNKRIETIVSSIQSGLLDPKVGFASRDDYGFDHFGMSTNETGFVDEDGSEYYFEYTRQQLNKDLKEIVGRYSEKAPHYPNKDSYTSDGEISPFKLQHLLAKYDPMDEDNYYFDDLKVMSWQRYKRQNELAILIQGLLDRSSFFGYTEASLFKDDFDEKIKLVYDKDKGLYHGEMPDFKVFIENCNKDSDIGDIFFGHQKIWDEIEEDKSRGYQHYNKTYIPEFLAAERIIKKRNGQVVVKFRWETKRDWWSTAKTPYKANTFECDINNLINISRYKPGDCKPFIEDPRCRDLYPKWGEFIITAETYHQKLIKNRDKN